MTIFSRPAARWVAAAVVTAGAVGTTGALALSSASASVTAASPAALTVKQIAFGAQLHHTFTVSGTSATKTDPLTQPDDITELGKHLFVGFQNGVGSQGEVSSDGNTDSTVVEFSLSGQELKQWDVTGKVDGLGADPATGQVVATVNEDLNSSLYAISPRTGKAVHYTYSKALPHNGGTDAVTFYRGQLVISASAPGTASGSPAAPNAAYPALYVVQLHPRTKVATVHSLYSDEATATAANGASAGKPVTLGLTDPDSSEVVPAASARFGGDFMLNSQGDQQLIFSRFSWWARHLSVLNISQSVDDSAWALGRDGALYATDSSADSIDVITGDLDRGTLYTAVTPCNANSAPSTCSDPNYLGTISLKTGDVAPVTTTGAHLTPKGLLWASR